MVLPSMADIPANWGFRQFLRRLRTRHRLADSKGMDNGTFDDVASLCPRSQAGHDRLKFLIAIHGILDVLAIASAERPMSKAIDRSGNVLFFLNHGFGHRIQRGCKSTAELNQIWLALEVVILLVV
jgi:hypothetical protein